MQQAFGPPSGKDEDADGSLDRPEDERGEAVAVMSLFAGAIRVVQESGQPSPVDFADPTEVVLLADLLMRLLEMGSTAASELAAG